MLVRGAVWLACIHIYIYIYMYPFPLKLPNHRGTPPKKGHTHLGPFSFGSVWPTSAQAIPAVGAAIRRPAAKFDVRMKFATKALTAIVLDL